jgi:tRNA(fMet)-specific endonuclease VapC
MLILDTDHLSILDQDSVESFNIGRRLASRDPTEVVVSIITYEEQMRGWLAYVARANTTERQVEAYPTLRRHVERFRTIPLVDYDENAASEFERLRQAHIRIGAMDLKIASIVLANDATLLSRNMVDFGRVPGLHVEDWTL